MPEPQSTNRTCSASGPTATATQDDLLKNLDEPRESIASLKLEREHLRYRTEVLEYNASARE